MNSEAKKGPHFSPATILVAAVVIGLGLVFTPWEHFRNIPLSTEITSPLRGLGDALLIAVVLALVVDKTVKRDFITDVTREVSVHLVGHLLPLELREEILSYTSFPFVRRDWRLVCTLERIPSDPAYVKLYIRSEYMLENLTYRPQVFRHRFGVEPSWFPEAGKSELLRFTATRDGKELYTCSSADADFRTESDEPFQTFSREVTIPARQHGEFRFFGESVEIFRDNFGTPLFVNDPTLGVTMIINRPEDLTVAVVFFKGDNFEPDVQCNRFHGHDEWRWPGSLLPGQVIWIKWQTGKNQKLRNADAPSIV